MTAQLGLGGIDAAPAEAPRWAGARFSDCRRYRWTLWRCWAGAEPTVLDGVLMSDKSRFVAWNMLNPSLAGGTWTEGDPGDPTIGKVIGFSRAWGFSGAIVANMWPWISTDPVGLRAARDMDALGAAIMQQADDAIREACAGAGRIVLAWGSHAKISSLVEARAAQVRHLIEDLPRRGPVVCLGRSPLVHRQVWSSGDTRDPGGPS